MRFLLVILLLFNVNMLLADKYEIFFPGGVANVGGNPNISRGYYIMYPGVLDENNIILPIDIQLRDERLSFPVYGYERSLLKTTDAGISWDTIKVTRTDQVDNDYSKIPFIDIGFYFSKDTMRIEYNNSSVCSSYDGGKTWDSVQIYPFKYDFECYVNHHISTPDPKHYIINYQSVFNDSLYYTNDYGKTFKSAYKKYNDSLNLAYMYFNYQKNKIFGMFRDYVIVGHASAFEYFYSKMGILDVKTNTWEYINSVPDNLNEFCFINDTLAFAIGDKVNILKDGETSYDYPSQRVVYKTTDGGYNWGKIYTSTDSIGGLVAYSFAYKFGRIHVFTLNGFIYSDDLGVTWKERFWDKYYAEHYSPGYVSILNKNTFLINSRYKAFNPLIKYTIEDSTSAINDETEELINVYPNPANTIVNIQANEDITAITLIDMSGLNLNTERFISGKNAELKLSGLASGVYFLNITCGNKTYTRKIVHTEDK